MRTLLTLDRTEGDEWFYSTLAEVSATIVGFLGAFLVIRLHAAMDEWRRESARVREARLLLVRLQDQLAGSASARDVERARSALDDLLVTADRQQLARFPMELTVGGAVLGGLLVVGVIAPLVALDAPGDAVQSAFLLPFGALTLLAAGLMYASAVLAWRSWQAMPLQEWRREHTAELDGFEER